MNNDAPADVPANPPTARQKVRGFTCPKCVGVKLHVYYTLRPAQGRVVRYRQCRRCGYRCTTKEHFGHILKPKKKGAPAA
jgi:hypothetical protein